MNSLIDNELLHAASLGDKTRISFLLEKGANVNAADAMGWTVLMKAIYNPEKGMGFPEIVNLLIKAGADIESPIAYGIRPLMFAAVYGQTEVVDLLLKAGSDILAKNKGGQTALMMLKGKQRTEITQLLHKAQSDCLLKRKPSQKPAKSIRAQRNKIIRFPNLT